MILVSFEKASQWPSFRSLPGGLSFFCLWQGHSSGVTSNTVASPSPDFGQATPWSDERCHHLVPIEGAGVSTTVGEEVAGLGLPIRVASWPVVAKRAAKDMFTVSNLEGYMSTPRLLQDRLVKPPPHASRKDWQSHPSFSMALHFKS